MPDLVPVVLADLARVFAALRVRWYVFGAQAVIAAGFVRTTLDIDVTVEMPRTGTAALLAALDRSGFTMRDVGDTATFIAQTRIVPVTHSATGIPVDVVLAGPGLEDEMMARAILRTVRGTKVPFVATDDLIALKLLAGRPKDLEDVAALLRARPRDLSLEVARQRVSELGAMIDDSTLTTSFDRLVQEATGGPSPRAKPKKPPATPATGRGGRASRTRRRR